MLSIFIIKKKYTYLIYQIKRQKYIWKYGTEIKYLKNDIKRKKVNAGN